jgi:hypothetical protein
MFFTDGFPLSTARLSAKRTFADGQDLPTARPSAKHYFADGLFSDHRQTLRPSATPVIPVVQYFDALPYSISLMLGH